MDELFTLAQALADPLRLSVLQHLMEGPTTVSELQSLTGQSQSNISNHLALLRERGLVHASRKGRHMIYTLHDASVGQLVESLTLVAGRVPAKVWKSPQLILARTCYDHLAGRYGVALFEALLLQGAITRPQEVRGEVALGPAGAALFHRLGLNIEALRRERRRFAFACPDWTERLPHLGGGLGAALWATFVEKSWVVTQQGTRAVIVTDRGKQALRDQFNIHVSDSGPLDES